MSRRPIIAGNWKMHITVPEAAALVDGLLPGCRGRADVEVILGPAFTALHAVSARVAGTGIGVAAQNMYHEPKGAFTGEVSPGMLKDAGCTHVLIGHSERRQYFGETDGLLNKKLFAALDNGITPIFCIGETLDERESGRAFEVIAKQLDGGLDGFTPEQAGKIVVAYEPVWAIGTGKTSSPEQAQEVHAFIRGRLKEKFGDVSASIRILYGGSVKPDNVKDLMSREDIDGALVGGAALKADSFQALVDFNK